ncbi:MAG: Crp/Fnr family transcriptional regulator [Niveispirillum sp.]|nr:Crp/Fnr family transcriptional regulator [Niveispirillum sp.]MBP7336157.1 Crp/Fnr family transcriptional regulator [Niveispirillum sp.]
MKATQIDAAWKGTAACHSCGVRHLVLFADLEAADFAHIHTPIEEVHVEAGTQLYGMGDVASSILTIRRGLVKLVTLLPDGTQRIVRLVRVGGVAGLEALVKPQYDHIAVALQPVEFCLIPVATIRQLQERTPRLHQRLMEKWHEALSTADGFLANLSTGNARQRVARLLLLLADETPYAPVRLFTREDMGAILAITLETASRTISDFKRGGAITDLGHGRVTCDIDALTRIAEAG